MRDRVKYGMLDGEGVGMGIKFISLYYSSLHIIYEPITTGGLQAFQKLGVGGGWRFQRLYGGQKAF